MEHAPNYHQGHLLVAASRVLDHRTGKPPTYEEIAELLGISHEVVGAIARGLEAHGIVKVLMTPFDVRVEVKDHAALETLPKDERSAAMKSEVEEFLKKARGRQEELEEKLAGGTSQADRKKRFEGLEDQLKDFQKRKIKDPFARSDPADSDGDDGGGDESPEGDGPT